MPQITSSTWTLYEGRFGVLESSAGDLFVYQVPLTATNTIVEYKSTDGGDTWSSRTVVTETNAIGQMSVAKDSSDNTAFVAYDNQIAAPDHELKAVIINLGTGSIVVAGVAATVPHVIDSLSTAVAGGFKYVAATSGIGMVMGTNYRRCFLHRWAGSWTTYDEKSFFPAQQDGVEADTFSVHIARGPGNTLLSLFEEDFVGTWLPASSAMGNVFNWAEISDSTHYLWTAVPAHNSVGDTTCFPLLRTSVSPYRTDLMTCSVSNPSSGSDLTVTVLNNAAFGGSSLSKTNVVAAMDDGNFMLFYPAVTDFRRIKSDDTDDTLIGPAGSTQSGITAALLSSGAIGFAYATTAGNGTSVYGEWAEVTEVTGDLSVTEATDTASMNGDVLVSGSSAVTEAQDTASFAGQVISEGDLAATEATDAASFGGQVLVAGDVAATEAQDAFVGAGDVLVSGTLSVTEAADAAAFVGKFDISLADEELVFEHQLVVDGGVYISPDGTRMYTANKTTREISQYDLRTPYKPDTGRFVGSLTPLAGGHRFTISPDGLKLVALDTDAKVLYQYSFGTAWDITSVGTTAGDIESQLNTLSGVASNFYISDNGLELYEQGYNGSFVQTLRHTSLSVAWDLSSTAGTEDEPFNGKLQGAWVSADGVKLVVGTSSQTLQQYTLPTPWSIVGLTYDSLSLAVDVPALQQFVIQDQYVYASDGTTGSKTIAWHTGISGIPYVPDPASFTATVEGTTNDMVLGISRELVMDLAAGEGRAGFLNLTAVLDPAPTAFSVTRENSDVRIDWTSPDGPFDLYRERRQGSFDNSTVSTTLTYPNNNGLGQNGLRNISVRDPDTVSADQLVTHNEGNGVRVYVFDSGVRTSHNVFEGRTATGIDVYSGDAQNDPTIDSDPGDGHGTPVASVIAGGGVGVAQEAIIVPIRCRAQNFGTTSIADLTAAVDWIVANHPAGTLGVANFSIVGWETGSADGIEARVQMQRLIDEGIICCWAALNEGINDLSDRSILSWGSSGVIVCGGYAPETDLNIFNYGPDVDIYAPAVVTAAARTSDTNVIDAFSGTSCATPIISGICALVIAEGEATTPAEIKQLVLDRSTKGVIRNLDATSHNRAAYSLAWDTELEIAQIAAQTYLDTTADVGKYRYWVRGETADGLPTTEWSAFQEIDLVLRGGQALAEGAANDGVVVASVVGDLAATEATDSLAAAGDVLITGTLAATEAQDAAALVGEVLVSGDLAATESIDTAEFNGATPNEGDLAATEAADTAALAGQVLVSGDLAVTEASDVVAAAGDVLVSGSFAVTEATDAAAIEGDVVVAGALAATEASDAFAATGELLVQGDVAATESQDVAALSGAVLLEGDMAVTEAADALVAAGDVLVSGALAATEETDAAALSGEVLVSGDLAATEPTDALASTGEVLVSGDLVATEAQDSAAFSGASINTGDLAATEPVDVAAFTGEALATVQGDLAVTEAQDTASLSGQVLVEGDLAATEVTDSASFDGQVVVAGDLAVTEATDAASVDGQVLVAGDLSATEEIDTAALNGVVLVSASMAVTEQADALAATGEIPVQGDLASTEATDSAAFAGEVLTFGDLVATETADTIVVSGELLVQGDLAVTEQADTASMSGASSVDGDLAATEATDTAVVSGDVLVSGTVDATEAADSATFAGGSVVQGTLDTTELPDAISFTGGVEVQGDFSATEQADTATAAGAVAVRGDLSATEAVDTVLFSGGIIVTGQMAASEAGDSATFQGEVPVSGTLDATEAKDTFSGFQLTPLDENVVARIVFTDGARRFKIDDAPRRVEFIDGPRRIKK